MQKVANSNLHDAKRAKKDEFYTQFNDIQEELKHYVEHFKNKVVLCNCNDPKVSQFFRYFANHFYDLGLKRLISTCYKNASGEEFHHELECERIQKENKDKLLKEQEPSLNIEGEKSCYFIYKGRDEDENDVELRENKKIDEFIARLKPRPLLNDKKYIKQNKLDFGEGELYPAGDFRSKHCIELLKEADIVVTNPRLFHFLENMSRNWWSMIRSF